MKRIFSLSGLLLALSLLFSLSGCYYDNEEELYQYVSDQQCDTTQITFSGTIQPIMTANCVSCHNTGNASGGITLDTYNGIKTVATNGSLWGSVSWSSGYSPMPQGGGKLSDCELKKIKAWINAGSPNN